MGRSASHALVDDVDLTYEDYLQLPDDGNHYEILDGDLAVTPSTASRDLGIKRKRYARFGVPHYWVLDPESRTLDVHRRFGRGYRRTAHLEGAESFRPALFPDLEIDLAPVWA